MGRDPFITGRNPYFSVLTLIDWSDTFPHEFLEVPSEMKHSFLLQSGIPWFGEILTRFSFLILIFPSSDLEQHKEELQTS
jgi:hypothetical protein